MLQYVKICSRILAQKRSEGKAPFYDLNQFMGRRLKITKHFLICRTTQIRLDVVDVDQHLAKRNAKRKRNSHAINGTRKRRKGTSKPVILAFDLNKRRRIICVTF